MPYSLRQILLAVVLTSAAAMLTQWLTSAVATADAADKTEDVKVLDVRFEPVGPERNTLVVKVRNATPATQVFAVHIQTRSPKAGPKGLGWGQPAFATLEADSSRECRFEFVLHEPVTDEATIRLRFYNPASREAYRFEDPFAEQRFTVAQLERRQPPATQPAGPADLPAVTAALTAMQQQLAQGQYEKAWDGLSESYRRLTFFDAEKFTQQMREFSPFGWDREELLELKADSAVRRGDVVVLTARRGQEIWTIDLVAQGESWKIDWIRGYARKADLWENWKARLLPTLECRAAEHLDIYYFKDSSAARDIESIAAEREKAVVEISKFLGLPAKLKGPRLRLVLFEDGRTKLRHTGHQGMGWADGRTMVEVYGEQGRLDPYHETAHALAAGLGSPPAIFSEGLAVYMSARLGTRPLEHLGGAEASLGQRASQLKGTDEWIALDSLLAFTEIGSTESNPPAAYAQAGSFVQFLIDQHGRDKFLQAYRQTVNSMHADSAAANRQALETIYEQPLAELEQQWLAAVGTMN